MPLFHELGLSDNDIEKVPQGIRSRIIERYSKIKGLERLQTQQMLVRDSRRLGAKARASYKSLGLDVQDEPPDENVLGDKTTVVNQFLPWATIAILGIGLIWGLANAWPGGHVPESSNSTAVDTRNNTTVSGGGR